MNQKITVALLSLMLFSGQVRADDNSASDFQLQIEQVAQGARLIGTCAVTGVTSTVAFGLENVPIVSYLVKFISFSLAGDKTSLIETSWNRDHDVDVLVASAGAGGLLGLAGSEIYDVIGGTETQMKADPSLSYFGTLVTMAGMADATGCLTAKRRIAQIQKELEAREGRTSGDQEHDRNGGNSF